MSSLNLPAHLGIPDEEKNIITRNWDTYTPLAERMAEKMLLQIPPPPYPIPNITQQALATAGNHSFELYEQLRTWLRYLSGEVATADSILLQIKNEKRTITARIRQSVKSKKSKDEKISETDIEDMIWLDPRFNELTLTEQQNIQYKKHVDALYEHCDGCINALSRSVEFRKENNGFYTKAQSVRPYQVPENSGTSPIPPTPSRRSKDAPSSPWTGRKE